MDDFIEDDDLASHEDFVARPKNVKNIQKKVNKINKDVQGMEVPNIIGRSYDYTNPSVAF